MDVKNICKNYFYGFHDFSALKSKNIKKNTICTLKIISYFTVIIPAAFAVTYTISSLVSRVTKKNPNLERDFLAKQALAEQGSAVEQFELGNLYENGLGVGLSYENALIWYNKAASQENPDAQERIGNHFQQVCVDYKEAANWYKKAADQNNCKALYSLGYLFSVGLGVEQSDEMAAKIYLKAAHLGDSKSQFAIGNRYKMGRGVDQNYEEAAKWFKKSADQGYHCAQTALGDLYEKGLGVEKNAKEATKWYELTESDRKASRNPFMIQSLIKKIQKIIGAVFL